VERARAGTVLLPSNQADVIAALDASTRMRRILGDDAVNVVVAVRGYEHENYADLEPAEMADKFRMAWSV
jgi:glutamine synthetase